MIKIVNGDGVVLGRLASYAAKESLKGENLIIVNCEKVLISGNKKSIKKEFDIKRARVGDSQKGPKHSKVSEKIVKRTIRGMLPEHRWGRGRIAFKKIKCYNKIPKEYENSRMINFSEIKKGKLHFLKEFER